MTPTSSREMDHMEFLEIAVEEAQQAYTLGHFPVGAVLVGPDGTILDRGHNKSKERGGHPLHAELSLILANSEYLFSHDWMISLYVSLEPCIMCLGAALLARLDYIVWAADDYWAGGTRSYNFNSDYLSSRRSKLIPPLSAKLRHSSCALVSAYLKAHSPDYEPRIIGDQL